MINTDHTPRSLLPHCTPAGDSSCEYTYLLQPPSELPCNPFHVEHTANKQNAKSVYSVNLTCVVAQSKNIASSGLEIRWVQMLGDSEPKCLKPINGSHKLFSPPPPEMEDFILFQSMLQMTKIDPPNGSDSYWCELSTDNKDIPCNSSNIFANNLTIHEPKFYNMLPPCPDDIYFHLAKTVCVTNSSTQCTPNSDCSDEDGSEDDPTDSHTEVIIAVCAGVGALILLTVAVAVVVCVLIRVKRKSKQHQKRNTSKKTACAVDTCTLLRSINMLQLAILYPHTVNHSTNTIATLIRSIYNCILVYYRNRKFRFHCTTCHRPGTDSDSSHLSPSYI